ncbi:gephyrin-like molybdotransferase Glp [Bacillus sp. FJAT-50079]|uniref:molybdopterin molybdotransferase MoeA n=1 Tax=Bacillus sp. FJAT-50079 TaxID=2833577 RepID=UPI001BC9C843|nr:gephyrin-like molybdotransferase Glp [Bacillus sp. FJAT-50079]MBS4209894.1 molybdopterin molybdotransferase MoeA [Bacillus sp. FJAT-50079]
MVDQRKPIWVKDAIDKVMKHKQRGGHELVSLDECDGRFLADPLIADHDVPPFDRSPYDGFALRAIDTKQASRENPLQFQVIDEIGAGQVSEKRLAPMEAIRIMTGAQIPEGADCVIMLELVQEVERAGLPFITIKRTIEPGDNISFQGEDTKKGTPLIEKGVKINPGIKALLATFGYSKVKVATRPVIGVIATGSELLRPEDELVPGKIRNSNGFMIESQILRAGAVYKRYGSYADDMDALYQAIEKALVECDMVITTGGVSVGDFDFLPEIYRKLGADLLFNKIAMRPGSVTSCGVTGDKLLFGLSGNPSACYIGFELFVRPIIRYWLHSDRPYLRKISGKLNIDFPKPNPFSRFVRSKMIVDNGQVLTEPVGLDKSGVVTSLAWADCLTVLPGGTRGYQAGDTIDVLLLEDEQGSETAWQEARFSK